ncbi:hypothetical protein Q1695_000986 [Nippostrongylus brasiliensis]|nr:hypothetical protein Q1695_000986 [Nippostrongylus brasiliensis]
MLKLICVLLAVVVVASMDPLYIDELENLVNDKVDNWELEELRSDDHSTRWAKFQRLRRILLRQTPAVKLKYRQRVLERRQEHDEDIDERVHRADDPQIKNFWKDILQVDTDMQISESDAAEKEFQLLARLTPEQRKEIGQEVLSLTIQRISEGVRQRHVPVCPQRYFSPASKPHKLNDGGITSVSPKFGLEMQKPPTVTCDVTVTSDRKAVYSTRIDSGPPIRKRIRDYEELYMKFKDALPLSTCAPPKKKLLQGDAKLQEKRRQWIIALTQTLIANHSNNEEIREFFGLVSSADDDDADVDLGPKEIKTACPADFDFLTTIGKGSFGRVFQVRHRESGKIYAMKVLSKEHIRKKNEVKHVMAELSVLKANFYHPFLVSLHFSFQNKDKLYFVVDHLNGGELFSHLQKDKTFSESRSRFYAAQIASAIGYLHENNIIYRDLKPENLLLDKHGYLVLTDFGLCKEGMTPTSVTNTFCGTPEYLAPEIILKKPYDVAVDWWCLGCVLYEMLYGLPPFYSRDHNEMYNRIVNEQLKMKKNISASSTDIVTKLLQKDKNKRLGSKSDFREVKEHEFFRTIDWDKLLRREIKAPFIPRIESETDVRNIAEDFVKIKINPASLIPQNLASTHRDHDFMNFTYVQKNKMS